jgi:hypothetical protein
VEQQPLFFEDIYDALRHVVQSAGGAKRVGTVLYPEKTPDSAGRALMDCLNPGRHEKLDPEQLMVLLRIGHEAGCHVAVHYLCGQAGYSKPDPIAPGDEKAELQRQLIRNMTEHRQLVNRLGLDPNGSKP